MCSVHTTDERHATLHTRGTGEVPCACQRGRGTSIRIIRLYYVVYDTVYTCGPEGLQVGILTILWSRPRGTRFAINDLSSNDLTIWGMKLYAVYTLTFDVGIEFLLAQCVYACTAEHAAEECCCDLSSGTHSHAGTP
jgi:hypothetical protein